MKSNIPSFIRGTDLLERGPVVGPLRELHQEHQAVEHQIRVLQPADHPNSRHFKRETINGNERK